RRSGRAGLRRLFRGVVHRLRRLRAGDGVPGMEGPRSRRTGAVRHVRVPVRHRPRARTQGVPPLMATRRFQQVDVFAAAPLGGNPVAVVVDGEALTSGEMQTFARWTNLSETTFLSAPTTDGADYAVRIFTPDEELPFAGHPTLGSCHAWLTAGGVPADGDTIVQECRAGLVRVRRSGASLAFAAPPLVRSG